MKNKLTLAEYHTLSNRYLTNSRIKDFQRCKKYFKELHITGERTKPQKDAFTVGSAVDAWLTRGKESFMREYIAVSRRSLKNPPVGVTELTMSQYEEIVGMCETLEAQPAYKELSDHKSQQIINIDFPINEHFIGLAAIPDWIKIEGNKCILTDLKTSNGTDERKHHYKCLDYGYYMQFAVMTIILRRTYPELNSFVYRHLVVDKDPDGIHTPYTFIIDNDRVEMHASYLLDTLIPQISNEINYEAKTVNWEDAQVIGAIDQEF